VPGAGAVGDRSLFSNQRDGMIQLNTFKGDKYLIITMLVPGAAAALMHKALKKS
jgi:hypothetical protein